MPRSRRINLPGTIYHVITRGHERKRIFADRADRIKFLKILSEAVKKTRCQCIAWVLMSNHVHLLIRNGESTLSHFMQKVLTQYAVYFNRRHRRSGYLFQNRFKSILCQEDVYFVELVRYIHLNPLRAGIVKSIDQLDRYPWSGHSVLIGLRENDWQQTDAVLEKFSPNRTQAVRQYRSFIQEGAKMPKPSDLSGGGLIRSAGGWDAVENLRKAGEYWRGDERILGDGEFVANALMAAEQSFVTAEKMKREGWNLERLTRLVCSHFAVPPETLYKKGRNNPLQHAKDLIVYLGVRKLGIRRRDLMHQLGISQPALSKAIERGEQLDQVSEIKLLN